MHNDIMAAGSRDHPPMLATGRYAQWQSSFLRYINTRPNGDSLRKCILEGPYQPTIVTISAVPATKNSPAIETVLTMSPENKAHFEAEKEAIHLLLTEIGDDIYSTVDACKTAHFEVEKEAIHLLLTGIRDDIYSTVDACKTAHEIWVAIERLQQVATLQVNIQFLQQLQPEWSRFVTIIKQQHDLDTVSYHKLFDVLKQYQKEVNEIRAERIAKSANPLALVAAASPNTDSYYQASEAKKSYPTQQKISIPIRSNVTTKNKGKEIAKLITPPSESASEEDSDHEQAQKDKDMQKNLALIAKKPKRVKDFTYHKEKMLLCKQAEKGVPLQAEHVDWLEDTDDEIDEHELEAHYSFMENIQEVVSL
nr:hypothetical protein [Tanacetum cinerariifolium]